MLCLWLALEAVRTAIYAVRMLGRELGQWWGLEQI